MDRLVEYEALAGGTGNAYTVADMMADLRDGVWREVSARRVSIDVYRRNLQRAYLESVNRVLNPPPPRQRPANLPPGFPFPAAQPRPASDARAVLRGELAELDELIEQAIERAADSMTRLHLRDVRMEIENLLDIN